MQSPEEALELAFNKPDLLVICGSRLYGTARLDDSGNMISDIDRRGFVIPPWEFLTTRTCPPRDFGDDHIVYGLKFFITNLLGCNPQILECLFAPKSHILACTKHGQTILDARHSFVSKKFYKRIMGFSNSEWRKACGEKVIIPERTRTEEDVIMDIRNVFGPRWGDDAKEIMDDILSLLFSRHEVKLVPSVDGITKKRRHEFDSFGYCSSSACHSIRLVRQCTELIRTGVFTFPRPDAVQLRQIKMGEFPFDDVKRIYAHALEECESEIASSKLPDSPDTESIQLMYEKMVAEALMSDERLTGVCQ